MAEKLLLVTSGDKFGSQARLAAGRYPGVVLVEDRSSNLGRVVRLLLRRRLSPWLVARMAWAEFRRAPAPRTPGAWRIHSNADLLEVLEKECPARVVLFRAGLIIGKHVLATGIPIMNIHCARVPEFGGLGSIDAALRAGAYDQCATLHQVTQAIDRGEVLMTRAYQLDPAKSYRVNEDVAYRAGLALLDDYLRTGQTSDEAGAP